MKGKTERYVCFASILRKVGIEISFFFKKKQKKRKKSDFLSFNILLPFQSRTLKNSYLDILNLEHFQD